jgi:hypothetical protein
LKEMKISAVDERDLDRSTLQLLSGQQAAESSSKNHNSMFLFHF